MEYGKFEDFKKHLINKRILMWSDDKLVLDDGTIVEIEMSENDCCAFAGGKFSDVKLDAMITNVGHLEGVKVNEDDNSGETESYGYINIYSNANVVAQAELNANDGNGGYYYSIVSAKVNDILYYPFMDDHGNDYTDDSVVGEKLY